jgi:hypothetical protein
MDYRRVRAVWYNNKFAENGKGTRNESRLTNFGGSESALLDADSTGSIAIFAFVPSATAGVSCHVWVCSHEIEEDVVEDRLGPIEPKTYVVWKPGTLTAPNLLGSTRADTIETCKLTQNTIPRSWLEKFPTGEEIIQKTLSLRPLPDTNSDLRLLKRRACEYEMFRSIEELTYGPKIQAGMPTLNEFLELAQSILQSRKSRSGTSLELHAKAILTEEGFSAETDFSYRPVIEGNNRPDFIFPSVSAYGDPNFPAERLRMLAAKTTCKERWRQVLKEANRIQHKHLLTLQEGMSENQFADMKAAGVTLVVPTGLHSAYPLSIRPQLVSLETFIAELRLLKLPS